MFPRLELYYVRLKVVPLFVFESLSLFINNFNLDVVLLKLATLSHQ